MRKLSILVVTALTTISLCAQLQTIDLSGKWKFNMGDNPEYNDSILLPGSMLTNGKGLPVNVKTQWVSSLYDSSYYFNPAMERYRQEGNMKFPFFLTPDKHYVGNAWYSRKVDIPESWENNRVLLHLERPHIETTVYVNGQECGRDSSLSVPHNFDITPYLKPGESNEIAICIYNGIENVCVGQDSHSVTDQTQGCWNGIAGDISLQARPKSYIDNIQIYPDVHNKKIDVMVEIGGDKGKKHKIELNMADGVSKTVNFEGDTARIELSMGDDIKLWDEFQPNLYTLTATLDGADTQEETFGMRDITIEGNQFMLNGHPIWLRGTVGNCCFPLTGYPPTDEQSWLDIFNKCKEYGLNMMRFHSYCPTEAAFAAADKVGFYLQPEGPSWPNHGVKLGRGMSIDRYLYEETERMVREYGNHPSFCMLAAGNEPAGDWVKWVGEFVDRWKATGDTRRVYCGASVGGGWAWDPRSQYHVKGGARGLDWTRQAPQSTDDFSQAISQFVQKGRTSTTTFDINEPYLSHEQGQWCAFPDLDEISQYTGAYKAGNFEIFRDLLESNGMASQAKKFLNASGKLQTLAYKYEMEKNLRTPGYAGFQLLSLNDYSGQGTALVGVLNVFWREKGYCNAADWTQFCSPVVPLAKFPKFVYTDSEKVSVPIVAYNAYSEALQDATANYTITDGQGNIVSEGKADLGSLPLGQNIDILNVEFLPSQSDKPSKYTLKAEIGSNNYLKTHNTWDFWVYPSHIDMPEAPDIYVTDTLDNKALEILSAGGKVLVTAAGKIKFGNDVVQHYLPVFWNTSWFKMRPPHTTGASIDTAHPIFKYFPSDDWANLNWWELINKAQVINLADFPAEYQSPVQPIDTWHVSRKLGMIAEANVNGGKLLLTTMDIDSAPEDRIVARQMRKALLSYMQSPEFEPSITLNQNVITRLFEEEAPKVDMFTKDSPDELKPKLK